MYIILYLYLWYLSFVLIVVPSLDSCYDVFYISLHIFYHMLVILGSCSTEFHTKPFKATECFTVNKLLILSLSLGKTPFNLKPGPFSHPQMLSQQHNYTRWHSKLIFSHTNRKAINKLVLVRKSVSWIITEKMSCIADMVHMFIKPLKRFTLFFSFFFFFWSS